MVWVELSWSAKPDWVSGGVVLPTLMESGTSGGGLPHLARSDRSEGPGFSSTLLYRSRMSSRHCVGVIQSSAMLLPPILMRLTCQLTLGNRVLPPLEIIHPSARDGTESGENKRSLGYQQVLAGFGNDPEHDIRSRQTEEVDSYKYLGTI